MENPNDTNEGADEPTSSPPSDSLEDWINRAKRTHELVDAIDLKKVTEHDAGEVAKLETVKHALENLEAGGTVEHVEGVDEVVAHSDEQQAQLSALVALIDKLGWSERTNRLLYRAGDGAELKPLELVPHLEGLPEFILCLAPQESNSVGFSGLFISTSGLFAASIQDPPSKYHWQIVRSRPYDDEEELVQSLHQFSQSAFE